MTPKKTSVEISNAIIAQLETSLNTTIPLFPKAFNRVIAKSLGGLFVLLYQFAGFILLQLFVKTASNKPVTIGGVEVTPLKLWGALVDIFQDEGQQAEYTIEIAVISQTGTLPSGTRVVNPSTGMIYVTVGDVALDAPTVYATIRATKVGELGNVDAGVELDFVSPPSTVEKIVTVYDILTVGVDEEETEHFRQRILERFAARPQGGAYADYRDWAQEVSGVERAYPYSGWQLQNHPDGDPPGEGAGEVFIYIESSGDPDGVPPPLGSYGRPPGSGLLATVWDHVENDTLGLANRRNINAYVRVYPITRTTFNVAVGGLANAEDETTVKAAIEAGLEAFFLDREPYITGLDIPPNKDIISHSNVAAAAGIIAASYGAVLIDVLVKEGASYIGDYRMLQEGEKAKLGMVQWL